MKGDIIRQAANVIALIATIAVNGLANALPLNGLTTGEISDRFQVYFVPAGYVFSIWSVIYLGLIAFVVYQALPAQRSNPRLRRVGYLFVLSCLANIAWLFLWHYEQFPLTLVAMGALLASLIAIYLQLRRDGSTVATAERWLVRLPFSIYLGWVSVATIANVTSTLDYLGWDGAGIAPPVWAVIMLAVGVLLALAMSLTRADVAYVIVLIWAYVGIAVKQSAVPLVTYAALAATGALVLVVVFTALRRRPAAA
jgi:benzodiazapine receptor